MRIVFISDTHGNHSDLGTLHGDVLIHCGDFCDGFFDEDQTLVEFDEWLGEQNFDVILCVGGNHDFLAETIYKSGKPVFKNAVYLVDETYHFNGINFYGSPWLPDLEGWANYLPDNKRKEKWELIPDSTDVLITHTPPFGILDKPRSERSIGCNFLSEAIQRVKPKIHCFGHVHASPGVVNDSGIEFINATMVNSKMEVVYEPIIRILEIDN